MNPVYVYTCLRDVNIDNIPPGFKTNFYGKVYEGGYLCEVRVKVKGDFRLGPYQHTTPPILVNKRCLATNPTKY